MTGRRSLLGADGWAFSTAARSLRRPLERFIAWESGSATLLIGAAIAALIWANTSASYLSFWDSRLIVTAGPFHLGESLRHWVNDLLMAVFFYVVALEVKREMLFGSLRDRRTALLPATAALGTMIGAALAYVAVNAPGGDLRGWAIPVATDIAFALGVLGMVGRRAPRELRTFLLTLAVVDDLAAIVVISVFFTSRLSYPWLGVAVALLATVVACQRAGVRSLTVYGVLAAALWLAIFEAGVHATVTGVLLGFLTPATASRSREEAAAEIRDDLISITQNDREVSESVLLRVADDADRAVAPLTRMEEAIHPYSSYLILPVFALANAGVPVSLGGIAAALSSRVGLGVFLGLVIGKPVGGMLAAWLATRMRLARMPPGLDWPAIGSVAPLKGIGFTIAIFITALAFDEQHLEDVATLAILAASLLAALAGLTTLLARHAVSRRRPAQPERNEAA